MEQNKTGKYLKYAIGEIVLVVIGILIALSINNWNEGRKNQRKAKTHLTLIRADLIQDIKDINRKTFWWSRVWCFKELYPDFELHSRLDSITPTKTSCNITYKQMFDYGSSFRSNTGAFDAMISDGSANLISNKTIFAKMQNLYKFWNPALLNYYNNNRAQSSNLKYKWGQLITYEPNTNITEAKDSKLIADITVYFTDLRFFTIQLARVKQLINETISEIDAELNK